MSSWIPKRLLTKILILVLAVGIIPLVLVGFQLISQSRSTLETLAQERQQNLVMSLAQNIDNFFEEIQRNLVVSLYGKENFYQENEDNQKKYFQFLVDTFPSVATITLFDTEGRVLNSVSTELLEKPPSEYQRHLDEAPVKEVVDSGAVVFSSVYYQAALEGAPHLTLGIPLSGKQGVKAVFAVEVTLNEIRELITKELQVGSATEIFVVDSQQQVILSRSESAKKAPFILDIELLKESTPQSRVYDYQSSTMVGAAAPLKNSWRVLIQEPEAVTFASAIRMREVVTFTVVLTMVLATWLGWLFSGALVKPLKELVHATKKIAQGDYRHRVALTTEDEIRTLSDSFNEMAENILIRNRQLSMLNETAKELASILDRKALVVSLEKIFNNFLEIRGVGLLVKLDDLWSDPKTRKNYEEGSWAAFSELISGTQESKLSSPENWNQNNHVCMPLHYQGNAKGQLWLYGNQNSFTDLEKEFIETVGTSVAISLTNIELLEKAVVGARMEEELKTAELVQRTLFPEKDPSFKNVELSGYIQSASETGGDWYGYLEDPDTDRFSVLIGDVTGHGVPAALVTAATRAFFSTIEGLRVHRTFDRVDQSFDYLAPDFLLKILNSVILETAHGRLVMTFFVSTIESKTGKMVFANAGHNPPYHLIANPSKPGKFIVPLKSRGVRLGDTAEVEFQNKECQLEANDAVCWYTDGLVECENLQGEEYGKKRMKAVLEDNREENVTLIKEKLLQEAFNFYGDQPRKDDITLIVGRFFGGTLKSS